MGVRRFYDRVYRLVLSDSIIDTAPYSCDQVMLMHKTIRDVTGHLRNLDYNTAIAFLMEYLNGIMKQDVAHKVMVEALVRLMAPFAPHLAEELWEMLGHDGSVFTAGWPAWDDSKITADTFPLVAQVNGKIRATIEAPVGISEEDAVALVESSMNLSGSSSSSKTPTR